MRKKKKTINIFGSSEKVVNLTDKKVKKLLKENDSIGVNTFGLLHDTDYILFCDTGFAEHLKYSGLYRGNKIITTRYMIINKLLNPKEQNIHDTFEPNAVYGSLANSGFWACWWAVEQGYEVINLYGILDSDLGYKVMANGKCQYTNAYHPTATSIFNEKEYQKFIELVETGFGGRVKINRPLL